MSAFLLAIKKLIAVITAIFIPTTSAAAVPVIPHHARVVNVSVTENYEDRSQMQIVEDEENINPMIDENGENAEDPANETPAPVEETPTPETPAEEIAPVETWDVSATEDDNVTMAFYDTEDTESLLNQLAGRITALFTPMTAYADDRIVEDNEDFTRLEDGNSAVEIIHNDMEATGNGEYGPDGGKVEETIYKAGTVVVSGEGNMMDCLYNYFISTELYVDTVVNLFREVEGIDVMPHYDESITDVVELDSTIVYIDVATNEEVTVSNNMKQALNPADMLEYSPTCVVIMDGVTNVSDCAFSMCSNIVSVIIPEGVVSIGESAFSYCNNLNTVELPSTLETIGYGAFEYCKSLDNIVLPESITTMGLAAFDHIADNATITIPNASIYEMFRYRHNINDFNVICNY